MPIAFATLGRGRDHAKWSAASAVTFQPRYVAELKKPKKASVLFDLDLKTSDGRAIDAKLFSNKKCDDVSTVLDLEKALHQVGHGTGRDAWHRRACESAERGNIRGQRDQQKSWKFRRCSAAA